MYFLAVRARAEILLARAVSDGRRVVSRLARSRGGRRLAASRVEFRSGGPQQPWGPPPGPPPRRGGKGKWILAGIAVLSVIAVTVVITVLVVGQDSGNSPSPTPTPTGGPTSDIASVNDKGPVTVITEDPTCASTTPILQTLADLQANGWTSAIRRHRPRRGRHLCAPNSKRSGTGCGALPTKWSRSRNAPHRG